MVFLLYVEGVIGLCVRKLFAYTAIFAPRCEFCGTILQFYRRYSVQITIL